MGTDLVSVRELKSALLGSSPPLVMDCRFDLADPGWGAGQHAIASLPGALHVDLDRDLSGVVPPKGESRAGGRHPLPSLEGFRGRMKHWAIAPGRDVVAFDHRGGPYASRLWWMLRAAGHPRVAVLDGGIAAWTAGGQELEPGRMVEGSEACVELENASENWPGTRDAEGLLQELDSLCLFDARAGARFSGEVEPYDRFGGHIPGSHSLPFAGNLDEGGKFLSPAELRARFESVLGEAAPQQRVAYCGSGVTACHNLLALRVAGLPDADLYPGSWSDWTSDDSRPRQSGA